MSFATIAIAATAATTVGSLAAIGFSYNKGVPQQPALGASSKAVAKAQADALVQQRALAAAEQEGGKATLPGYNQGAASNKALKQLQNQLNQANNQAASLQQRANNARGKPNYDALVAKANEAKQRASDLTDTLSSARSGSPVYFNANGKAVANSEAVTDFSGYSTADIQGKLAHQTAQIQQDLGAKYGTQFAEEAAKEAALADPQGTQARAAEYQMLQDELNHPKPINPLSPELENQIDTQVKAGAGLDPASRELLDQSVAAANAARGGGASAADVEQAMSTGQSGQSRLQTALSKGGNFVSSGVSPADINYRRAQQTIANLGAFVGGRTPESQFASLSGAGQGAAPFSPGQPMPSMPNNAAQTGIPYSVSAYQDQIRAAMGQASPWLGGLSTLMAGVGALGQTGLNTSGKTG